MLSVNLCGIRLENLTILASGIMGLSKASLDYVIKNGAGAVTIKSVSTNPRKGHSNPIIITFEAGMMNAVGYSNPGYKEALKEFKNMKLSAPVIGSIVGQDAEEFAFLTENFIEKLDFDAVEIPLSCPHTPGYGTLAGHGTPEATYEITKAVREKTKLPIFVKVSPNIAAIGAVAKAAEKAGANAITAVNTMGPGMVINPETTQPVLDFKMGGISGPALKPVAVRCIYDIYKSVKIPIIGVGGVTTGRDAIEMIMAGATAVGVGSAIYYRGIDVFEKISNEIKEFMLANNYKEVKEMIGLAH